MTPDQSSSRTQRLQEDLEDVVKLHELAPSSMRFVTAGRSRIAPESYDIEASIKGIVGIDKNGMPIYCDHFKIKILLSDRYPEQRGPECKVYPAPFHPNFRIEIPLLGWGGYYGTWIDPKNRDEKLGSFILRILQNIRYNPIYIDTETENIGNDDALSWYMCWHEFFSKATTFFPTDTVKLPSDTTRKRFDIQRKSLDVGDMVNSEDSQMAQNRGRKTFQITNTTLSYVPELISIPDFSTIETSDFRGSCDTHRMYIKKKALDKIFHHITWGKRTSANQVEQGGILLGRAFKDDRQSLIYGIIEDAIDGESAVGTSAYLEMRHDTWEEMLNRADMLLDLDRSSKLQIIGWYHTHPNNLDVFMSGTDTNTQRLLFAEEWQFAIVLNPHKRIWRVFHGRDSEECQGFVVKP